MTHAPNEYLVTYPGFDGPDTRGLAYLAVLGRTLAIVGEVDDNPGRGTVDAIELIAQGLVDAGLVDEDYSLLNYLPQDHVRGGKAALWKIEWHARDGNDLPWWGKPTWDPVPTDLFPAAMNSFQDVIASHGEWTAEALDLEVNETIDLMGDDDLIAGIENSLRDDPGSYVWGEIAELAYDAGAGYVEDSGKVTEVRAIERRARDRWVVEANVSLDVIRPEGDPVEASDYPVMLALWGVSPTAPSDVEVIG